MTTRRLKSSDLPALRAIAEKSGLPYPEINGEHIEAAIVVVDDEDRPLMAAAAERIVQLYLWCGEFERPHAKVHALRLLHEAMAVELKRRGYSEANAFLPPEVAAKFSRRLEKTFGWARNWPSWFHKF